MKMYFKWKDDLDIFSSRLEIVYMIKRAANKEKFTAERILGILTDNVKYNQKNLWLAKTYCSQKLLMNIQAFKHYR